MVAGCWECAIRTEDLPIIAAGSVDLGDKRWRVEHRCNSTRHRCNSTRLPSVQPNPGGGRLALRG